MAQYQRRATDCFPLPDGKRYYATIDVDGFDPSIAPGTGTPSHGGFLYYEVFELFLSAPAQSQRFAPGSRP